MQQSIHIRELMTKTPDQLNRELPDAISVTFDDGKTGIYHRRKILFSAMFWGYYRHFSNVPVTEVAMVETLMKGKPLNAKTSVEFQTRIARTIGEYNIEAKRRSLAGSGEMFFDMSDPEVKRALFRLNDETRNLAYNYLNSLSQAYVNSIDWMDFVEIMEHPELIGVIAKVQQNASSVTIELAYKEIKEFLLKNEDLKNNPVVRAVRSGMVNMNQVMQCVGIRGVPTEVNGALLREPIKTNYTLGMNDIYSYTADSRSAAKALYNSERPLEEAVYFSRRLELLCMTVETIAAGDCGSQDYVEWRVRGREFDEYGLQSYPGDMAFLVGKHYLDESSGQLRTISVQDAQERAEEFRGRKLLLRSAHRCKHPDPHVVCETCFGALSSNVPPKANLGHLCSATMTQQTNQSVLSTKHLDASAVALAIVLSAIARRHFDLNDTRNGYKLRADLVGKPVMMYVSRDQVYGMTDITTARSLEDLSPSRISSIETVLIERDADGLILRDEIIVSQSKRKASFTMAFLRYLREHGWSSDDRGNFVIDLSKWHNQEAIAMLPDMEYSFSDHAKQIAELIESSQKKAAARQHGSNPDAVLKELFQLVNSKLAVNIACLEVIVYAAMNYGPGDYRLARNSPTACMGVSELTIRHRNISHAYAYEGISKTIMNPETFFPENRTDSVLDVFFAPFQMMESIKHLQAMHTYSHLPR